MKRLFSTALLLLLSLYTLAQDGPYVIYNPDNTVRVVSFDKELNPQSRSYKGRQKIKPLQVYSEKGDYQFTTPLHEITTPSDTYPMPDRILVLSDPHGDIVPFVSVLQGAGAINDQLDWSFGNGHLMVIGDVADRGKDVTTIYWLLYKLEKQARKAGGEVHMLLGNHEIMVAQADLRYVQKKYKEGAEKIGTTVEALWSDSTELGRWLLSRNQIERIGDILFVHAGLSPELIETGLGIGEINTMVRKYMTLARSEAKSTPLPALVMGTPGPLWYRGMVNVGEEPVKLTAEEFARIQSYFGVDRIVVGHTIHPQVTNYFDGKLIAVNVRNSHNMKHKLSQAILITRDDVWPIKANGARTEFVRQ